MPVELKDIWDRKDPFPTYELVAESVDEGIVVLNYVSIL
jgi:hypothetical protein